MIPYQSITRADGSSPFHARDFHGAEKVAGRPRGRPPTFRPVGTAVAPLQGVVARKQPMVFCQIEHQSASGVVELVVNLRHRAEVSLDSAILEVVRQRVGDEFSIGVGSHWMDDGACLRLSTCAVESRIVQESYGG